MDIKVATPPVSPVFRPLSPLRRRATVTPAVAEKPPEVDPSIYLSISSMCVCVYVCVNTKTHDQHAHTGHTTFTQPAQLTGEFAPASCSHSRSSNRP